MAEPRIFITGSSTGLGNATARLFAQRGWQVIATMRDPPGDLADVARVTPLALDVTDPAQIHAAADQAMAGGAIDVVFNNAGYGLAGPLEAITDAQLVRQVETNLLGAIRVAQVFVPHLRARGAGTIITTTSVGALTAYPFHSIYHATKWALEGFSESLAFELARFGVAVKTVSPGGIVSDFHARSIDLASHPAYDADAAKVLGAFRDPARRASYSSAAQIAETVWEAATDGKDQLRYVAGADARAIYAHRLAVGDEAFRKGVAAQLFGR